MEPVRSSVSQQRRIKRLVPDSEKDETYWEKRKRNNIAAKKSRENRRQNECLVRSRIQALEEENTLLRKELEIVKDRFGIPKDVCVLSQSERDECLEACLKAQKTSSRSPKACAESQSTGSNMSDFNLFTYDNESSRIDVSEDKQVDCLTQVNNYVWSVTPAHSQSLQRYAERLKIYRNDISIEQTSGSSMSNKRKRESYSNDDNLTPADLSTKRNFSSGADQCLRQISREIERMPEKNYERAHTSFLETNMKNSIKAVRTVNSYNQSNSEDHPADKLCEVIGSHDPTDAEDMTDSDIRTKLQLLSDQVEKMQKLVCNTSE